MQINNRPQLHDLIEIQYRLVRDIHAALIPPAAREELLIMAIDLLSKMEATRGIIADEEQDAAAAAPPDPDPAPKQTDAELLAILRAGPRSALN